MTPEEQVARVLAEHRDRRVCDEQGWAWRCECGHADPSGTYRAHEAHVAAEVVKALGLREESDRLIVVQRGVRNRVRFVTDWREVES